MNPASHPRCAIDACCLLNLYASGRFLEVLECQPFLAITSSKAAAESGYVVAGHDEQGEILRETVDLGPATTQGLLQVVPLVSDAEMDLFVEWAALVDDGEAETIAIALASGAALIATDDAKARREIDTHAGQIRLLDTPHLMRTWAETKRVSPADLAAALCAIERRGRFRPNPRATHSAWWYANASPVSA